MRVNATYCEVPCHVQFSVEAHDPSPGGYISKVVWDLESIQDKAEASQSQADAPVHVYRRPYNSYVAAVTVTSALGKDTWMALEPVQTTPAHYPFAPMVVDAHTLAILRPSSLASGIVLRDPHIGGKPVAGATIGTWGSPALSNDNLLWMKQRSGFSVAFKDANDSVSFRLPRSYSALASNATLSVALKLFVHAAAPSGLPGQPIGTGHSGDAGSGIALNILAGFTQDWQRYFAVAAGKWDKTGPWLELNSPQNPAHDKSTRLLTATNLSRAMPYGSWYQVEFALTPTSSSYYVNGALVARSCEFAQFFDASKPMNLTFGSFNGFVDDVMISTVVRAPPGAPPCPPRPPPPPAPPPGPHPVPPHPVPPPGSAWHCVHFNSSTTLKCKRAANQTACQRTACKALGANFTQDVDHNRAAPGCGDCWCCARSRSRQVWLTAK